MEERALGCRPFTAGTRLSLQEPVTSRATRRYKRKQRARKQGVTRARNHHPQPVTATNPPLSLPTRPEALCLWHKA